ncbi:MAG: helix-turn-helix transcriptional regulator [Deltaproteobacteria bacterium]|nr:helix-turn-helix transcriptional regulator [Deltaproteobacteria bacterium]
MECSPAKVGRRLKTLHGTDARAIRAEVLTAIRTVAGMDFSLFYSLADVDGKTHLSEWQADGDDGLVDRIMSPLARAPWPGESFLNLQTPEPRSTRSFVEWSAMGLRDEIEQSPVFRRIYAPHGLADQLRLLVYCGNQFVGWLGGVRRRGAPRFGREDRRQLDPLVEGAVSALCAADALARGEVTGAPAFVMLLPDGSVESASESARAWLQWPELRVLLEKNARAMDQGAEQEGVLALRQALVRMVRLDGPGGVRYLARLGHAAAVRRRPEAALPRSQREVAELAAAGMSIREIADAVRLTRNTVRWYLREVYTSLEVSNRVELARALAGEHVPRPTGS